MVRNNLSRALTIMLTYAVLEEVQPKPAFVAPEPIITRTKAENKFWDICNTGESSSADL